MNPLLRVFRGERVGHVVHDLVERVGKQRDGSWSYAYKVRFSNGNEESDEDTIFPTYDDDGRMVPATWADAMKVVRRDFDLDRSIIDISAWDDAGNSGGFSR